MHRLPLADERLYRFHAPKLQPQLVRITNRLSRSYPTNVFAYSGLGILAGYDPCHPFLKDNSFLNFALAGTPVQRL